MLQTLTCLQCERQWERELVRGQKPKRCPACRDTIGPQRPSGDPVTELIQRVVNDAVRQRVEEPPTTKVSGTYRVRIGENLYHGGRFTLEQARTMVKALSFGELPIAEGGQRIHIIHETIVESVP